MSNWVFAVNFWLDRNHIRDHRDSMGGVDRFAEVVIAARFDALVHVALHRVAGKRDERHWRCECIGHESDS